MANEKYWMLEAIPYNDSLTVAGFGFMILTIVLKTERVDLPVVVWGARHVSGVLQEWRNHLVNFGIESFIENDKRLLIDSQDIPEVSFFCNVQGIGLGAAIHMGVSLVVENDVGEVGGLQR